MSSSSSATALCVLIASLTTVVLGCPPEPPPGLPPNSWQYVCTCQLTNNGEPRLRCAHADLSQLIRAISALTPSVGSRSSLGELILEANHLPTLGGPGGLILPGGSSSGLRLARLMVRDNGLEHLGPDWSQTWLDIHSLVELYIVEPALQEITRNALSRLPRLEALTVEAGQLRRAPRLDSMPSLRYIRLVAPRLEILESGWLNDLPSLEELHVIDAILLRLLPPTVIRGLPRLRILNITNCGLENIDPAALITLPSLHTIHLEGNRILDLGAILPAIRATPNLSVLSLKGNRLPRIERQALSDLSALTELDLASNRIERLEAGAFARLPSLRRLDLASNFLREIEPRALQEAANTLEEISLAYNLISRPDYIQTVLSALPRITILDARGNRVTSLPAGSIRAHHRLERLDLSSNRISMIGRGALEALPALRELNLAENSIPGAGYAGAPPWDLPALKGLDLSKNALRRIDAGLLDRLPSLRRLALAENAIGIIEPDAFLTCPNLEQLDLAANGLTEIPRGALRPLRALFALDLGENRLVNLPPDLPAALEVLRLRANQLSSLPEPPPRLPALRQLDLTGNVLSRLPPGILRGMPRLQRLQLAENKLISIENDALGGLTRLEILELRGNQLRDIASHSLPALKHLDIASNRLERLDNQVLAEAPALRWLDISENRLFDLILPSSPLAALEHLSAAGNAFINPPDISGLKSLERLDVGTNRINLWVPTRPGDLGSIKELRLTGNRLRSLSTNSFNRLPRIETLDLSSNEIESIESAAISDLPELRALLLAGNKLNTLEPGRLTRLPRLAILDLSSNHLTHQPRAALSAIGASIQVLDLSANRLNKLSEADLAPLPWLEQLNLDDNGICAVEGSPFTQLSRLRLVSLRNNRMAMVSERAFATLKKSATKLDVHGNPINCECQAVWLQQWLLSAEMDPEGDTNGLTCSDGTPLREARLQRSECPASGGPGRAVDDFCPPIGISSPLKGISSPSKGVLPGSPSSEVISTWMKVQNKSNTTQAPTPEESEYFYDEYVEYPVEDNRTSTLSSLINSQQSIVSTTFAPAPLSSVSPHLISGDTPTLYAAPISTRFPPPAITVKPPQKGKPASSFTFFGIPLPSIWNNKARNVDQQSETGLRQQSEIGLRQESETEIRQQPETGHRQQSEKGFRQQSETGFGPQPETGFRPLTPQRGGFTPIMGPHQKSSISKVIPVSHQQHIMSTHKIDTYTNGNGNGVDASKEIISIKKHKQLTSLESQEILEYNSKDKESSNNSNLSTFPTSEIINPAVSIKQEVSFPSIPMTPKFEISRPSFDKTNWDNIKGPGYEMSELTSPLPTEEFMWDINRGPGLAASPASTTQPEVNYIPPDDSAYQALPMTNQEEEGAALNIELDDRTASGLIRETPTTIPPTSPSPKTIVPWNGPSLSDLLVPSSSSSATAAGRSSISRVIPSASANHANEGLLEIDDTVPVASGPLDWYYRNYNRTDIQPYVSPAVTRRYGHNSASAIFNNALLITMTIFVRNLVL